MNLSPDPGNSRVLRELETQETSFRNFPATHHGAPPGQAIRRVTFPPDGISSTACVQLRNGLGGSEDIYAEVVFEDQ